MFLVQVTLACTGELTECFRGFWVVMEHRTLVQRSSQGVQREPCSPMEQPGHVAQSSQLLRCGGSFESLSEAETRGALPEKVFNSQKVDFSAGEKFFERCLSVETFLAIPLAQEGLVVLCGRVRQVADYVFLNRVVQPGTVQIGHDWLPGEPV